MGRKILLIIVLAALLGGFLGSLTFSYLAQATSPVKLTANDGNFFNNFYNNYLKPLFPNFQTQTSGTPISLPPGSPAIPYTPTIDYEQAVVKAVEQASPAVVAITISKNVPIIEECPYNPFSNLPPEFQQFFGQGFQFSQPCQKGTQLQEVGGGSGFIISSDGLIVTNKHVVLDEKAQYTVFTNDGKKYGAQILARDPTSDLAILKITAQNLPVLELGDSSTLKLGQTAIAIGNALGEFRNTVSVGVISGLSRSITASGAGVSESIGGLIQTDAAINPGNSGGPLLNLKGEVIGINTAMVSGAQNIGFALPINQVKRAIESVRRTGSIISPFLGVRYVLLNADSAQAKSLKIENGALVQNSNDGPAVVAGSPAEKAGIKNKDVILEINGEKITADNPPSAIIQKYNVGDTITLKILRDGKEINLSVTLAERPKNL